MGREVEGFILEFGKEERLVDPPLFGNTSNCDINKDWCSHVSNANNGLEDDGFDADDWSKGPPNSQAHSAIHSPHPPCLVLRAFDFPCNSVLNHAFTIH
ncbi:unnamed protein product [Sphenostylis stenocarpa]|uniref:Uncharacterized protein n=1 Tax=Sphenostylis stenocarpa TaxID=92480 RepID=A0AA86VR03_9FABA|nr:unnamed protein product [Sphenostylis stenocarpa]